jgi:hypothetical protein
VFGFDNEPFAAKSFAHRSAFGIGSEAVFAMLAEQSEHIMRSPDQQGCWGYAGYSA